MKFFHGRWDIMGRADFAVPYHIEGTHVPFFHSRFSRSRNIPGGVPEGEERMSGQVALSASLLLLHLSTANSFSQLFSFCHVMVSLVCGIMRQCERLHPCFG